MTFSAISYVAAALLFGVLSATASGFSIVTAEGIGAASVGLLLAVPFWLVRRRRHKTASLPRAMFWWSLALLAINALPKPPP